MGKGYIDKEDLETGAWYRCKARNFTIGKWVGDRFEYTRQKFTMRFTDYEYHWDDGAPFGTVKPLEKVSHES